MTERDFFQHLGGFITAVTGFHREFSKRIQDIRITPMQQSLMCFLYFSGRQTLSDLSQSLNINLPNCSREVKKLHQKGFVRKVPSPKDKRKILLELSLPGKDLIDQSLVRMRESFLKQKGDWAEMNIQSCILAMEVLRREIFDI